jgi:hypothetical protein
MSRSTPEAQRVIAARYALRHRHPCADCGVLVGYQSRLCGPCSWAVRSRRSVETLADRFWPRVDRSGGPDVCWPWTGKTIHGYGFISRNHRHVGTHRVAWELTNGPIPDGLWVLHRCDNPPCCNPAHLWLGTVADNMADAAIKERLRSKITAAQVYEIRVRAARGEARAALAIEYGVSRWAVRDYIQGAERIHVPFPPDLIGLAAGPGGSQ